MHPILDPLELLENEGATWFTTAYQCFYVEFLGRKPS